MANKSLTVSSRFNRLMSLLALPLLSRRNHGKVKCDPCPEEPLAAVQADGEPVFYLWPDVPNKAVSPQDYIQAGEARLHQTPFINHIK